MGTFLLFSRLGYVQLAILLPIVCIHQMLIYNSLYRYFLLVSIACMLANGGLDYACMHYTGSLVFVPLVTIVLRAAMLGLHCAFLVHRGMWPPKITRKAVKLAHVVLGQMCANYSVNIAAMAGLSVLVATTGTDETIVHETAYKFYFNLLIVLEGCKLATYLVVSRAQTHAALKDAWVLLVVQMCGLLLYWCVVHPLLLSGLITSNPRQERLLKQMTVSLIITSCVTSVHTIPEGFLLARAKQNLLTMFKLFNTAMKAVFIVVFFYAGHISLWSACLVGLAMGRVPFALCVSFAALRQLGKERRAQASRC